MVETTPSVLEGPCVRISFEPCLAQSCVARLRQKRKPVIFFGSINKNRDTVECKARYFKKDNYSFVLLDNVGHLQVQ